MMNWNQLLTAVRTGQEDRTETQHDRTQFQRDFDRLIFSSPFRRLQDKTQVFPLPGGVFVHNRLTHSLEVSCVGRSLGNNLARILEKRGDVTTDLVHEIGSAVAAACLAHDMGNPPFGHSGEMALSHYFLNGEGNVFKNKITPSQWNDITNFEGNANAFRLLTHAFNGRRKGGFALTYTTLASILKYPYASATPGRKKYGFFDSEREEYLKLAKSLGLPEIEPGIFARHPLVYLVEAADDICYQFMDIEDAHKLKILSTDETRDLFMGFIDIESDPKMEMRINDVFTEVSDINEQMAFLRATVIGRLVTACTDIFIKNEAIILQGGFNGALVDHLEGEMGAAMKKCQQTAYDRIYKHPSVVEIEIAGFKILGCLLDEFIKAVTNPDNYYSKLLLPFIPEQFKPSTDVSCYQQIQCVLDFVSGMTDVYALELYRKINGMGLKNKSL
jgi:dGTPase